MNEIAEWWSKSPCEAWHGTAEAGSKEWSDQIRVHRYFVQPHIREFADFPRWKGKRVLEIGCGIGTDTIEFAKAGAHVSAIDISEESLKIARKRVDQLGLSEVYFGMNMGRLHKGQYDLVYSFGVIHHAEEPELLLEQAHEAMKSDGGLRIMLYAKWSLKHLLGTQPEAQPNCPLVRWYSFRSARRLLESCGFEVTSIRKTHIFPWKIGPYKEHRFVNSFPWNICPEWLFRWLESKLGHHLLLVAKRGSNG